MRRCQRLIQFLFPLKEVDWSSEGEAAQKADRLQGEGSPAVCTNTKDMPKHGSIILLELRKSKDASISIVTIRGIIQRGNRGFREGDCGIWWCWDKQFLLYKLISWESGRRGEQLAPLFPEEQRKVCCSLNCRSERRAESERLKVLLHLECFLFVLFIKE